MTGADGMARRDALGLAALGAAAALAGPAAALPPAGGAPLDLGTPAGRLRAYMLMRGALDDRLVIGCATGRYYGVVAAELTPLFGVVAATFARYRPRPGGGYDAVTLEYAFFTDPATGRAIGEFRNPYTGETVTVPAGGYAPSQIAILPDLGLKLGRAFPGTTFDYAVQPFEARGDDVWVTELTRTAHAVAGAARPARYSEAVTLHARRSELEAPGAARVPCETSFTNVVTWRPWLNMGDRAGHMMAVGAGRYGATMATLPTAWIEAARAQQPELLADPAAQLDRGWSEGG